MERSRCKHKQLIHFPLLLREQPELSLPHDSGIGREDHAISYSDPPDAHSRRSAGSEHGDDDKMLHLQRGVQSERHTRRTPPSFKDDGEILAQYTEHMSMASDTTSAPAMSPPSHLPTPPHEDAAGYHTHMPAAPKTATAIVEGLTVCDSKTAIQQVLRRAQPGQYVIYRSRDINLSHGFAPVFISFQTPHLQPAHNVVYYNVSMRGEWEPFIGWVTICPDPWNQSNATELVDSKMLFPSMEDLCAGLAELTTRMDTDALSAAGASTRSSSASDGAVGYRRPHPLLPMRKSELEDEWEAEETLAPQLMRTLHTIAHESPPSRSYQRSATTDAVGGGTRGGVGGGGWEGVGTAAMAPQGRGSGEEAGEVGAGHAGMGLEALDRRVWEKIEARAQGEFMLVRKVEERREETAGQVAPRVPLSVQHLLASVTPDDQWLPDMTARRNLSQPEAADSSAGGQGSRIRCPSATAQGKGWWASDPAEGRRNKRLVGYGKGVGKTNSSGVPSRLGRCSQVRVRKHLVMCAVRGGVLEFWKEKRAAVARDDEDDTCGPQSGGGGGGGGELYHGKIKLTAASKVEVDRLGYELKVHVVFLSEDKTDAVTDTYTFVQAPEHVAPRRDLCDIAHLISQEIDALRSGKGRMVEFDVDPIKHKVKSVKSAPPLWEGPLRPEGFEDAPLLDGYIPHFLGEGGWQGQKKRGPQVAALAARFNRRKHQLWTALHQLKSSAVGSEEAVAALDTLLHRHDAPASVPLPAPAPPGELRSSAGRPSQGEFAATLKADDPARALRGDDEWDYSQYRMDGVSAEVWDVLQSGGLIAIRHTATGISLVVQSGSSRVEAGMVSCSGEEFVLEAHEGLSHRLLPGNQRNALLAFAARYDATEEGTRGGRGWQVGHDWSRVVTYGAWSMLERSKQRCAVIHSADPGGGIHLLPNGFVIFVNEKEALLHLLNEEGPVGPVMLAHSAALSVFAERPDERPDAPHNLCAWRPSGHFRTADIQMLQQDRVIACVNAILPPVNLTVAGQPPFEWKVAPELPGGLMLVRIDDYTAQILGVPAREAEAKQYSITALNVFGLSCTSINISVLMAPAELTYRSSEMVLEVGLPLRSLVTHLRGSAPMSFKCSRRLPPGLVLDPKTGTIHGSLAADPSFPPKYEIEVTIVAANPVGSSSFSIVMSNGPRVMVPADQEDLQPSGQSEVCFSSTRDSLPYTPPPFAFDWQPSTLNPPPCWLGPCDSMPPQGSTTAAIIRAGLTLHLHFAPFTHHSEPQQMADKKTVMRKAIYGEVLLSFQERSRVHKSLCQMQTLHPATYTL
jgi:hypothetical protein